MPCMGTEFFGGRSVRAPQWGDPRRRGHGCQFWARCWRAVTRRCSQRGALQVAPAVKRLDQAEQFALEFRRFAR
eukprot:10585127-Lingulodinium_polyedra.AAC.1